MRKLFLPILFISVSCTKEKNWKCTISHSDNGVDYEESQTVTFHGTKEEKDHYEDQGTHSTSSFDGQTFYVKTECK